MCKEDDEQPLIISEIVELNHNVLLNHYLLYIDVICECSCAHAIAIFLTLLLGLYIRNNMIESMFPTRASDSEWKNEQYLPKGHSKLARTGLT